MKIEFYGHGVRLNDSEAAHLVTARSDLRFTLREQFPANAIVANRLVDDRHVLEVGT